MKAFLMMVVATVGLGAAGMNEARADHFHSGYGHNHGYGHGGGYGYGGGYGGGYRALPYGSAYRGWGGPGCGVYPSYGYAYPSYGYVAPSYGYGVPGNGISVYGNGFGFSYWR